jgi:hypothetical protein
LDGRTQHQIADLLERQEAHERRLSILLLQAAQSGRSTAAEITVEVREIQVEVLEIAEQITKLQIKETKSGIWQHRAESTADLADVSFQLSSATESIRKFQIYNFEQLKQWFDIDTSSRKKRQRITNAFYLSVVVMLAIDILLRIFY